MTHPIETIRGRGLPLPGNDIDTDQIIESRYLKMTTFRGMEKHVFESLRNRARRAGGAPHPFDAPDHAGASILLVGRNFGCGSSREHAPQALHRFGIRAIVGEYFGEIFAGNCLAIGLPLYAIGSSGAFRDAATGADALDFRTPLDAFVFAGCSGRQKRHEYSPACSSGSETLTVVGVTNGSAWS